MINKFHFKKPKCKIPVIIIYNMVKYRKKKKKNNLITKRISNYNKKHVLIRQ